MSSKAAQPLTCIARVYSPSQAALKLSALEAAGFDVFMPWYHTLSTLQHHAIALGGLPVLIPSSRADEAMDFLEHIEEADEAAREASPLPRVGPNSLFWRLIMAYVYFSTATGPAMNLTFLNKNR